MENYLVGVVDGELLYADSFEKAVDIWLDLRKTDTQDPTEKPYIVLVNHIEQTKVKEREAISLHYHFFSERDIWKKAYEMQRDGEFNE